MLDALARDHYYDAALIGLRVLEAREGRGRRFGPDADATWAAFAGDLHPDADRMELLLRDAAAAWGLAFNARAIFALPATAVDDPFGRSWPSRGAARLSSAGPDSLDAAVAALGLTVRPVTLPDLSPTSRLVLGGPSAMVAAARAFAATPGLTWDRQVTVVADTPTHRQLAGLCALFVPTDAPTRVLRSTDALPTGTVVCAADADAHVARVLGPA